MQHHAAVGAEVPRGVQWVGRRRVERHARLRRVWVEEVHHVALPRDEVVRGVGVPPDEAHALRKRKDRRHLRRRRRRASAGWSARASARGRAVQSRAGHGRRGAGRALGT